MIFANMRDKPIDKSDFALVNLKCKYTWALREVSPSMNSRPLNSGISFSPCKNADADSTDLSTYLLKSIFGLSVLTPQSWGQKSPHFKCAYSHEVSAILRRTQRNFALSNGVAQSGHKTSTKTWQRRDKNVTKIDTTNTQPFLI